eukprot:TRINITY_DN12024_c0_g1_i4.p1 TRINITY_DN12024_c0_g1~~TRINITY_DN12024_c0_g1_i4.p1  ORF type:complete len:615 (+),score=154.08 TRINITY_DN12024_c0_g1_i4:1319-3163(+)
MADATGTSMDCTPDRLDRSAVRRPSKANDESILLLPDEVLLKLFSYIYIEDLCNLSMTCKRLLRLSSCRQLLSSCHFGDGWPSVRTQHHYQRAADQGNTEAIIKLGVANLYGEGVDANVDRAGELLIKAEAAARHMSPYTWLLFRPPWSSDYCSKACIYRLMHDQVLASETDGHTPSNEIVGNMAFCVAKTLALEDPPDIKEAVRFYSISLRHGCGFAAPELLQAQAWEDSATDPDHAARVLQSARHTHSFTVDMALCRQYAQGHLGRETKAGAMAYVAHVMRQGCKPGPPPSKSHVKLDPDGKMRFILMDWLVEVADLKSFDRHTLYMAMDLVDRYLARCKITRKTLQLLGIACMVIAARFLEPDVITIREAAWLTDNTYTYEQIVRTIGQVLFSVRGNVRTPTMLEYLEVIVHFSKVSTSVAEFAFTLAETALLRVTHTMHPPAHMAAAVAFVAFNVGGLLDPWPIRVSNWTQITVKEFANLARQVFGYYSSSEVIKDHREVPLRAVREHYTKKVQSLGLTDYLEEDKLTSEAFEEALGYKLASAQASDRSMAAPTPTNESNLSSSSALRSITNVEPGNLPKRACADSGIAGLASSESSSLHSEGSLLDGLL